MATSRQIKCIIQSSWKERHERITSVGGDWGRVSSEDAIRHIENGTYTYYVRVNGYDAKVIVAERLGRKYLKTESDTTTVDNLLSLPTCS